MLFMTPSATYQYRRGNAGEMGGIRVRIIKQKQNQREFLKCGLERSPPRVLLSVWPERWSPLTRCSAAGDCLHSTVSRCHWRWRWLQAHLGRAFWLNTEAQMQKNCCQALSTRRPGQYISLGLPQAAVKNLTGDPQAFCWTFSHGQLCVQKMTSELRVHCGRDSQIHCSAAAF